MSQIIKYLLVALLSIALTILYLDQYAPIIVEVPEKVSQRMEIEFSKEIERKQRKSKEIQRKQPTHHIACWRKSSKEIEGNRRQPKEIKGHQRKSQEVSPPTS